MLLFGVFVAFVLIMIIEGDVSMARYIDADILIETIENDCLEQVYYSKQDAIGCIECFPTADVVEVVRCKVLLLSQGAYPL